MKQVGSNARSASSGHSTRNAGTPNELLALAEQRHRALDERLRELGGRVYLTPTESLEVSDLKKHKLQAKDAMAALAAMGGLSAPHRSP